MPRSSGVAGTAEPSALQCVRCRAIDVYHRHRRSLRLQGIAVATSTDHLQRLVGETKLHAWLISLRIVTISREYYGDGRP